jgi:hypothetical protein
LVLRIKGPWHFPAKYSVSLAKVVDGEITELVAQQEFECKVLGLATLAAQDKVAVLEFQNEVSALRRVVLGTNNYLRELSNKLDIMAVAAKEGPSVPASLLTEIRKVEAEIAEINRTFRGDGTLAKRQYPTDPTVIDRVGGIVYGLWESSSAPTETMKESLEIAEEQFEEIYQKIKKVGETDIVVSGEKTGCCWSAVCTREIT